MTRPKLLVLHPEPEKQNGGRDSKKYRFELSKKKLVFYSICLTAALCWMFVIGLLVGRGVALVSAEDVSIRAEFMRFLGLGQKTEQPVRKAAETWGDPKKMLESLNYYEDLTGQSVPPVAALPKPATQEPVASAPAVEQAKESAPGRSVPQAPAAAAAPREKSAGQEEKNVKAAPPSSPTIASAEQFTLLVASLKDPENAQRLVDQLKTKGYSPRLEALDLHGGGRWNRVLVGSFNTREAALKFAAEFNRKESMEGLVIREVAQ